MSDYDEPWQCLELVVQCLLSRVDNTDLLCMLEDLDINSLDDIRSISEADLFESIERFGFDSMCSTNLIARFHVRVLRRVSLLLQYERYPMTLREWREMSSQSFVDWIVPELCDNVYGARSTRVTIGDYNLRNDLSLMQDVF